VCAPSACLAGFTRFFSVAKNVPSRATLKQDNISLGRVTLVLKMAGLSEKENTFIQEPSGLHPSEPPGRAPLDRIDPCTARA
jgi:hypothetical protein